MKYLYGALAVIIAVGLVYALASYNTYTSSPGFTSREQAEQFYEQVPQCYGWSVLVNREATYADAPGRSICIGYLSR
jgi:hypothetical protein